MDETEQACLTDQTPEVCLTDLTLALEDNTPVESQMVIEDDVQVSEICMTIDIDHTWPGDMVVDLVTPSENVISVIPRYQGFSDSYSLVVDPAESSLGTWTLQLEDKGAGDSGTLYGWCMRLGPCQE